MTGKKTRYINCIRSCYPDLVIEKTRFHNADGQFNEILIVNDAIIFRFPYSDEGAAAVTTVAAMLTHLQPRLPLAIPNPRFHNAGGTCCPRTFMGYRMLPGEPLRRETMDGIWDEALLDRLAEQLADFLRTLHGLPVEDLGLTLPVQDGQEVWQQMYEAFRTELFPFMRPDARISVTETFERYLNDPRQFDYVPALRHGDFGPSNILYDPAGQRISGIIDFDSIAVGDPAIDAGAVATLGEPFFQRMCRTYPELVAMRERTAFYQSTYALQEALYGLRNNVPASFKAGIAPYR